MTKQIQRGYGRAAQTDGRRYLSDWLWPRGVKKEDL
jgi:uncharacterized protein YeaO (DUF488 family)